MARGLSAYWQDVLEACNAIEDVMSGISLEECLSKRAMRGNSVFGVVYSGLIVLQAEVSELLHDSSGVSWLCYHWSRLQGISYVTRARTSKPCRDSTRKLLDFRVDCTLPRPPPSTAVDRSDVHNRTGSLGASPRLCWTE